MWFIDLLIVYLALGTPIGVFIGLRYTGKIDGRILGLVLGTILVWPAAAVHVLGNVEFASLFNRINEPSFERPRRPSFDTSREFYAIAQHPNPMLAAKCLARRRYNRIRTISEID